MVGWHYQLNGHEFKQALEDGEGQGSLGMLQSMGSQRVRHNRETEQHHGVNGYKLTIHKIEKQQGFTVYCYPAYLTYMQITSCKIPGWMNRE